MFSQSNEDEIIAEIFDKIGTTNKRFVEFGCGDGRQNNTIALLHKGWSGIWCEPHRRRRDSAMMRFANYPVEIIRKFVVPRNVNTIVKDPLDFLSIDIDGNDHAVWRAVQAKPRVVCIEYDAVLGVSLEEMVELGTRKGYRLNCCSASNVNAFFVRDDIDV
jgi:hypothetical protein